MMTIGSVGALHGQVIAEDLVGNQRVLVTGDDVFEGEQILSTAGSSVAIKMLSGDVILVEDGQAWLPTYEAYTNSDGFVEKESVIDAEQVTVLAALLSGEDPTEVAPATAAGEAASAEELGKDGAKFVRSEHLSDVNEALALASLLEPLSDQPDQSTPIDRNVPPYFDVPPSEFNPFSGNLTDPLARIDPSTPSPITPSPITPTPGVPSVPIVDVPTVPDDIVISPPPLPDDSDTPIDRVILPNPASQGGIIVTGTSADEILTGTNFDDVLKASQGNDVLIGRQGNDIMSGELGADTFMFESGDNLGGGDIDKISDFNMAEGDKIDLSDLLDGENTNNLVNYLDFSLDGSDTVIKLQTNGGSLTDHVIRLSNVDIVTGTQSTQEILENLKNHLVVDDV